jgi:hypothetical protein
MITRIHFEDESIAQWRRQLVFRFRVLSNPQGVTILQLEPVVDKKLVIYIFPLLELKKNHSKRIFFLKDYNFIA